MTARRFTSLACPLDGLPLAHQGNSWRCPDGHSFDVARQGYVHLLPVQNKRSLRPGDSKEMIAARRRFLSAGYYRPIADAVNRALLAKVTDLNRPLNCLDAGCGEGYYLQALSDAATGRDLALMGLDISKWAVLAAAKTQTAAQWVVGTNARLPLLSASTDRVLCLFGFPVYEEFRRVLRPGGQIVQVDAGPDHLRELREIIYPTVNPGQPVNHEAPEGFTLAGEQSLNFSLALNAQQPIHDLLAMTPHLYRASAEGRDRALALETLAVTADVRLRVFEVNQD